MRTMIVRFLEKQFLTPSSIDKVVLINENEYGNTRKLGLVDINCGKRLALYFIIDGFTRKAEKDSRKERKDLYINYHFAGRSPQPGHRK